MVPLASSARDLHSPAACDPSGAEPPQDAVQGHRVLHKVYWHLLPTLFCAGLLNNLDRANLSFAATELSADLHFTKATYGLGAGIFFIGYAFQVPATLLCIRVGPPRFLGASLVCWGSVAASFSGLQSATHFYLLRFILGLCEAGAYPAIWYHLSLFLDDAELGEAYATVSTASALNGLVGGPIAALFLSFDGLLGLSGWQWLFLLEGIPAVVAGGFIWSMLAPGPASAGFLTPSEQQWLVARQARAAQAAGKPAATGWGFITEWRIWYVGAIWGLTTVALDGLQAWAPVILQDILFGSGSKLSGRAEEQHLHRAVMAALLSAIPFGFAALGMVAIAHHAKATRERHWHTGGSMFMGAAAAAALALALGRVSWVAFCALTATLLGIWGVHGPLLSWPAAVLDSRNAAAGFALVKTVGAFGAFAGTSLIGLLATERGGYRGSMVVLSCCLLLGGVLSIAFPEPGKLVEVEGLRKLLQWKATRSKDQELEPFLPAMVPLAEGPMLHSPGVYLAMLELQSGQAQADVQPRKHAEVSGSA